MDQKASNGGREIADQIADEAQASRALLRSLGEDA